MDNTQDHIGDGREIRFSGSGGQGLILATRILASALMAGGFNVAQSQSYEPVSRGGQSRSDLIVSKGEADYPLSSRLDYLLILHDAAADASDELLSKDSLVLVDTELVPTPPEGAHQTISLPFTATARKLGNKQAANMVALGALVSTSGLCARDRLEQAVKDLTPARFSALNLEAIDAGWNLPAIAGEG